MDYNQAEGNCCKDSQNLNVRHVMRTVNSQVERKTTIKNESCDYEPDIHNDKIKRRQDFRFKKKNKKKDKKYVIRPHSSFPLFDEFVNKIQNLDQAAATEICEVLFVALYCKVRTSSLERALLIIAKLIKTHLGVNYADVFSKITSKEFSFFKSIYSWNLEKLEAFFKQLLTNWNIACKNEAFGAIMTMLSTFLAIFYGADKKWSFTVGSFSIFLLDARNSCKGATSFIDAVLKIITYVVGGFKKYIASGSYTGFLYADDQLAAFDAKVSDLKTKMSLIQPGNLEKCTGTDENAFDQELQHAIASGEKLILLYDGSTKKYVMDRVRYLKQIHIDFIQFRAAGGLRVAPFAYLLSGSTGLGKSSVNEILMRYILSINGYNHQDAYICTLNSQDKFYSTYRSYINGVIFDDFANTHKDFVEQSPCETLLKFVNNIPFYLNMAELELKGKVVAEPKVVGITTNVSDIDSSVYSNQASSIMRRMKVHIYAKVKKEFQKEGTVEIDSSKVNAIFGDSLVPDIWTFDVFNVSVTPIARPPKLDENENNPHRDDRWKLVYAQCNGLDMKDVTISELLLYVKQASKIHFVEQNKLIERSKMFNNQIVCSDCSNFLNFCTCIPTISDIDSSISDLRSVISEVNSVLTENSIPSLVPHSLGAEIYDRALDVRDSVLDTDLRSMLFTWLLEGKCSLEKVTDSFLSNCSKEIQYLLIVFRGIAERWFLQHRKELIESFFPLEFDGTAVGDYFCQIARKSELKKVAMVSSGFNLAMYTGVGFVATNVFRRNWLGGCSMMLFGHYAINRIKVPRAVTQMYDEISDSISWVKSKIDHIGRKEVLLYSTPFLASGLMSYFPKHAERIQQVSGYALLLGLCIQSNTNMIRYEVPRALSSLYRKKKAGINEDWNKIAPASLTLATLYYSKNDIMDFYTEAWEAWYLKPHSRLRPNVKEIEERDKKHRFDESWFKTQAEAFLDPLPTSTISTPKEVRLAIEDNVWFTVNLETNSKSNCFVVCSGCILIPLHFVPKKVSKFSFIKHSRGNSGNKTFTSVVDPAQCVRVKDYDLAMMWMPKTRDVKSLISYFPLEIHATDDDRTGLIATRSEEGFLSWDDVRELKYTLRATSGLGYIFPGVCYFWKGAKEGKCMSPVISDDKRACISGFHIGGSTKQRHDGLYLSFGVSPTQTDLLEAKSELERFATVIPMSNSGDFYPDNMGVKVLQRCIKKKSCYLRMENDNCAHFLGSSMNCNRTPKSMVRDTPIKQAVKLKFGIDEEWGPPKFKGEDGHSPYKPWEEGMNKWIVDRPGLPFGLLNRAKIEYTNNLARVLYTNREYWSSEIKILTWDETINGIPGKRFIDSMNFKSSIGFPFKGSKRLFSTCLGNTGEGWQDKRILNKEFIEEAEKIISLYKRGKRYYPWFTSTLKDEPTPLTKSKVRIFQASSTPFQLVIRKYTLGVCRFLQMNPLDSECAVGIDPCSIEWNELYQHLSGMQTPLFNRWFAIDYKAYDTSISSQLIMAIGRVFTDIARIVGYTDEDIAVLNSIFTELSFSVVDFNGDVLMLDGANPSGNPLTVFINNLSNSFLMRIYFYHLYPRYNFINHVRIMGYGDDLIGSVRSTVGYFNMRGYAAYLSNFGFTVTPADKEEVLTDYVKLDKVDFLKRKFVWSADFGAVIAPLDEPSIYKRLCNYMSSETDVEVIVGGNIDGALDEWAFYGKSIYLDRQKKLNEIINEFKLQRFVSRTHLTYEQRVVLWKEHNAGPAVMDEGQGMDTSEFDCDVNSLGFFGWGRIVSNLGLGGPPTSHNSESYSSDDSLSINKRTSKQQKRGEVDTNNLLNAEELRTFNWDISPHSSFAMVSEEIMTMADGSSNQLLEIPNSIDETRRANDASDNSLGSFLSRPIKIKTIDWTPGTQVDTTVLPWDVFLANKRVVNRIANYKLIRGKMKVKILLNGNSFFYGRTMASYWPLPGFDKMTVNTLADIDNVQFSQMPRVFLDPTLSQGGEMTLPFFWHNDYLDILGTDKAQMGVIAFRELNRLKHTSGDVTTATKVTITVYAWLEDVQLEGPTQQNPSYIVPQSTPGNEIADLTESLCNIGPFALPSSLDCTRKEVNKKEPQLFIPKAVGNLMSTNVMDTCAKMTYDKNQMLTVDPRILGLGSQDEMTINSIATRESYLTKFSWTQAAVKETLLFNLRVDPCHWRQVVTGPITQLAFTAPCGAALPFRWWNGTFKLRLQFVTSAFHRGRVAVVYDPHRTSAVREDNVAYTHIVDISACRDVTFAVGPNQDRALMPHAVPGVDLITDMSATTALATAVNGNGTIAIYVLNELSLPNAISTVNNDISVNVFVSMGDDFEVFMPSGRQGDYTIVPQSTGVDMITDVPDQIEESEPYESKVMELDTHTKQSNKRDLVFAGESIDSFRSILKRYHLWAAFRSEPISGTTEFTHRIFPAYRGNVTGAVHTTTAATPYNYFHQTLLNYLTPAFQAWRGSIRYKILPRTSGATNNTKLTHYVSLNETADYAIVTNTVSPASPSAIARTSLFAGGFRTKYSGALAFINTVNPVIEYEVPWYDAKRFCPGKVQNWTTLNTSRDEVNEGVTVFLDSVATATAFYDVFLTIGEDFSLYYFTGWPPMYYYPAAPP